MIEKDALRLFGRRLDKVIPVQDKALLPSDLLRLVRELQDRDETERRLRDRLRAAA